MLEPASLILYERYENGLYAVANDLAERAGHVPIRLTIGDVTDAARVDAVMSEHRPQLVFHAAAHKHVPLMESNPCEAVKNNVAGTQTMAEAARRHSVERFVFISTDKAANPSSVMGATKRIAEMVVQVVGDDCQTRFVTVRFGNVLGSNGSVIPRMLDQIRAGGPVTVTHPEIRRYFMLIPEAVELVLHAVALAQNREAFVLDMGEQVKVLDVARNLIRLSGLVPDRDVPITFIGLRPGEKMTEELVGDGETLEPSGIGKIFRVRWDRVPERGLLMEHIELLVRAAAMGHVPETMLLLQQIVPTLGQPGYSLAVDRGSFV
jgi:FlaA1/EpsC-like NDP-sugar epimerase